VARGKPDGPDRLLIKLREYRCPILNRDKEDLDLGEESEVKESDFVLDGTRLKSSMSGAGSSWFGPAKYKGLKWVGEISEMFLEAWIKDPVTGSAIRKGNREVGHQQGENSILC
jgi:hypothetical protein